MYGAGLLDDGDEGAVHVGDTIAGLKYIGRRFVADVARAENLHKRPFMGRLGMQISLARETATALRRVRSTQQLA